MAEQLMKMTAEELKGKGSAGLPKPTVKKRAKTVRKVKSKHHKHAEKEKTPEVVPIEMKEEKKDDGGSKGNQEDVKDEEDTGATASEVVKEQNIDLDFEVSTSGKLASVGTWDKGSLQGNQDLNIGLSRPAVKMENVEKSAVRKETEEIDMAGETEEKHLAVRPSTTTDALCEGIAFKHDRYSTAPLTGPGKTYLLDQALLEKGREELLLLHAAQREAAQELRATQEAVEKAKEELVWRTRMQVYASDFNMEYNETKIMQDAMPHCKKDHSVQVMSQFKATSEWSIFSSAPWEHDLSPLRAGSALVPSDLAMAQMQCA